MKFGNKSKLLLLSTITSALLLTGCSSSGLTNQDNLINGKYLSDVNITNMYNYDVYGDYSFIDNLYKEILDTYEVKDSDLYTEFEKFKKESLGITEINSDNIADVQQAYTNYKINFLTTYLYMDVLDLDEKEIRKSYEENKKTISILQFSISTDMSDASNIAKTIKSKFEKVKSSTELQKLTNSLVKEYNASEKNVDEEIADIVKDDSPNLVTASTVDYNKYQLKNFNSDGLALIDNLEQGKTLIVDNSKTNKNITVYKKFTEYEDLYENYKMLYVNEKADEAKITNSLSAILEKLNAKKESDTNFTEELIKKVKAEEKVRLQVQENSQENMTEEEVKQMEKEAKKLEKKLNEAGSLDGDNAEDMEDAVNTFTK